MAQTTYKYSTRDALTVQAQIEADAVLKVSPAWWKRGISNLFDVLNNTLNAVANAIFPNSWYDRTITQDVLDIIGYRMSWKTPSSVICTVTVNAAATSGGPYTISKANLAWSTTGTMTNPALRFEARAPVTLSIGTTTTSVTLYQQTTQTQKNIGLTSGQSWQQLELPDVDIIQDTLVITISGNTYSRVNNFANSLPTDKHFKLYYRTDGSAYIVLGGVNAQTSQQYGFIPSASITVYADYATGGGATTNIAANTLTTYLGSDAMVTGLSQPSAATRGLDEETIANARAVAPISLRTANGFINASSGLAIMRSISGVQDGQVVKSGILAVDAYVMPIGGGTPSGALLAAVQAELVARSPLEAVTVTMHSPTYLNTSIICQIKMLSGWDFTTQSRYIKLALLQRADANGYYVSAIYFSQGLSAAIAQINTVWSVIIGHTFTVDVDGASVKKILDSVGYQSFGENLAVPSDIDRALSYVDGIDYINITNPTSDLVPGNGGIIQVIGVTLTQL